MRLKDKTVLITGASKGIGKALAIGMAKEGADIIINYNSDKKGAEDTKAAVEALGRKAWIEQCDISSTDSIFAMYKRIQTYTKQIDVLVNNAAITGWGKVFELTPEKWDYVINTNLRGTFFCSVEAARMMKEHGGGSIINISTNCAELGVKNLVAYSSSKGGVHAMTKQLAIELAQYKIRVNTFAPGPTNVERNLSDDPEYRTSWGSMVPMKRTADAEEMVGPAVFLACEDSSYMTGQVFFVDGGWTVQGKIPEANAEMAANKNK